MLELGVMVWCVLEHSVMECGVLGYGAWCYVAVCVGAQCDGARCVGVRSMVCWSAVCSILAFSLTLEGRMDCAIFDVMAMTWPPLFLPLLHLASIGFFSFRRS